MENFYTDMTFKKLITDLHIFLKYKLLYFNIKF